MCLWHTRLAKLLSVETLGEGQEKRGWCCRQNVSGVHDGNHSYQRRAKSSRLALKRLAVQVSCKHSQYPTVHAIKQSRKSRKQEPKNWHSLPSASFTVTVSVTCSSPRRCQKALSNRQARHQKHHHLHRDHQHHRHQQYQFQYHHHIIYILGADDTGLCGRFSRCFLAHDMGFMYRFCYGFLFYT